MITRRSISSNELVFPAPRSGSYLDDHNFSQKVWRKVLVKVEVRHRKFYRTRSTFISHALQSGIHPIEVAAFVGDNVAAIYRYYAGSITELNNIPMLF
jgi:integrase